jgi:hypothetical protein
MTPDPTEQEYLANEMPPAEVERRGGERKALMAVRFDPADIDRLRAAAEAQRTSVSELVRRWVVERLDAPPSPLQTQLDDITAKMREVVGAISGFEATWPHLSVPTLSKFLREHARGARR